MQRFDFTFGRKSRDVKKKVLNELVRHTAARKWINPFKLILRIVALRSAKIIEFFFSSKKANKKNQSKNSFRYYRAQSARGLIYLLLLVVMNKTEP